MKNLNVTIKRELKKLPIDMQTYNSMESSLHRGSYSKFFREYDNIYEKFFKIYMECSKKITKVTYKQHLERMFELGCYIHSYVNVGGKNEQ